MAEHGGVEQGGVAVPRAEDELRLALAMRGGVSLAVWIGGAAAEVDRLCRADPGRDQFWSRLVQLAGYERVVVDVMSGASAGGLNAVIAAAATTYDFPLDGLRELWVEVGSLREMVRHLRGDANSDGLSLLEGDEYFLTKLDEKLVALSARGGDGPARRVDVTLAATLLEPIAVQRVRGLADTTEARYTSTFRFRHGGPVRTDFPRGEVERRRALARLAIAGRATSSFPAAFEAALVTAPRGASFTDSPVADGPDGAVVMTGVFGESTARGRPFCVMDGGVLDNIPIARAIDAIVEAPADGPTRRVLVYVQPGSAGALSEPVDGAPDRSTVAVVKALVRTRVQEETIAGDLRQLEAHNRRARRARFGAVEAVRNLDDVAQLTEVHGASADGATRLLAARYAALRAGQETSDVTRLLDDPIGTLGGDPFPMIADESATEVDRRWRAPLAELWEPAWAQGLAGELARNLRDRFERTTASHGHALTIGVGPLRRLTILLIDACNALYRCATNDVQRDQANQTKGALYRVLAVHSEIVERPRRWAWVALAAQVAGDDSWFDSAVERIEALTAEAPQFDLDGYLDDADQMVDAAAPLAAADTAMRARLDALVEGGPPWPGDGADVRDELLQRLCRLGKRLGDAGALDCAALGSLAEQGDLGAVLLSWLRTPVPDAVSWIQRLAALEMATYDPEIPDGPGSRPIDFVRLSGANVTPLAAAFPRLLGEEAPDDPWSDIVDRLQAPAPALDENNKLAGNELMNFSAFLRDRWRENDWMWGRLDAAVTLVDVLVEPSRLRQLVTALPPTVDRLAALVDWFRQAVVAPNAEMSTRLWQHFLEATAWEPRLPAIRAVLGRIVAEVDGAVGNDGSTTPVAPGDLGPLREALVASRQWQILGELLPGDDEPYLDQGAAEPQALVRRANEYDVGIETIDKPPDPADRDLVHQLAGATRAMLGRESTGAIHRATRTAAIGVGLLDWLWLDRQHWARVWSGVLILLGFVGLTLPIMLTVDGAATRVVAATAGFVGIVLVAGVALLVGGRIVAMSWRWFAAAFMVIAIASAAVVAVSLIGGSAAVAITAAVVALPLLVTGIAIGALIICRPALFRQ